MLSLLLASALTASGPGPRCTAPRPQAAKVEEARVQAIGSPLYLFAVKSFGPPAACGGTFHRTPDGQSSRLTFHFADGSTLTFEVSPPETIVETLQAKSPLRDVAGAKAALQAEAKNSNGSINWGTKPSPTRGPTGTTARTYWDSTPDSNLGVDLLYRGTDLVGLRFHLAL